ncbi:hypothetical protein U14_05347 [Candidatus Moduliflexus flocculans]|uniref:Uncharacterized protein n=1 Tax=Candidatus Moduliflexus flocculans TaxID=1499966 RepID=A0A081BRN9_9BACT|nr:hypothetical protein U14_05347 [Candidatus Moduliflexus flocculans]
MQSKKTWHILRVVIFYMSAIIAFCGVNQTILAADLTVEVTDFEGNVIQLQHARAFIPTPTSCDSCPPKIVTLDGIKVMVDDAPQIILWENIVRIEKEHGDKDTLTLLLTDGKTQLVELFTELDQFLAGDRTQDEYNAIRIKEITKIEVIRGNKEEPR